MRPLRHSLIRKQREKAAGEYARASGGTSSARPVKTEIYATGKSSILSDAHTDSALALPVGAVADAEKSGLVPQIAQVSEAISAPNNKMGENLSETHVARWSTANDEHLGHVQLVMTDRGEVKTVMVRRPTEKQICIIDWINFSVAEETWNKTAREQLITDEQFVCEASRQLEKIFGFGVTQKCKSGKNFFTDSWMLGDGMGFVCFGSQKSKMGIIVSGHGCLHALPGWEVRLHAFLTKVAISPTISRIDLAHDDFDGEYLSVDWADAQWDQGGFNMAKGGRPPEPRHLGSWKRPSGKGRTFTIGLRTSSKYARFYEKGKKEGDRDSNWCRCEIEFSNASQIIRPDVLLNPSEFFLGAYPCLDHLKKFGEVDATARFEVKRRAAVINHDAAEKWLTVQCGKYFRVWRELYGDKEALDRLCCTDDDFWPKRLKVLTDSATSGAIPIHKQEATQLPGFLHFIKTVPSFGLNGENGFA